MMTGIRFIILLGIGIWVSACQKTGNPSDNGQNTNGSQVGRLTYGDTLFFNHTLPGDKLVAVVSAPSQAVTYKSIPGGMVMDSLTGSLNISKSESGIRYKIFAVNASGLAIDSVKIVISGVDYSDGIFQLDLTPLAYDTAFPVYNARPELALPCPDDDDDGDDDDECEFDETDLNNDGNDDIAGVIQDKLLVNKKTGTIDLEASFRAGLFGSSNPVNGSLKNLLMYYRLNDASSRALQKVNLQIYYYRTINDIPQLLRNELAARNVQIQNVNARSVITSEFVSYQKPKRPPILIIVGGL